MKIGILVDSSSGLTNETTKNTNIEVLPLHILVENTKDYLDTQEIKTEFKIYDQIKNKVHVTTSQASPGELTEKYEKMLKKYDHIIHLSIPSNLSGMFQTSVMVSKMDEFAGRVTVLNHFLAANILAKIAFKFNEMVKNENIQIEDFQKEIDEWSKNSLLYLIPSDYSSLAKGGRAKSVLLSVLKLFKTKLAIQWEEKPRKGGISRTITGLIEKLYDAIVTKFKEKFKLLLVYTEVVSQKLIETIREKMNLKKINYQEEILPTSFACHAGLDTVAIIAYKEELE
ncbi:fatty acid-binding protein DegV [Spiroplasma helicoides]|uniref:Fatty acid-binding protein DegV n=1 Tax=Spiroplasma helicoides TaxID=216938 RepID=A0A1B3SLG6_9MOLU|nr:DegV family protein [Spiroplasma helicoides]AOG60763.1 fatty acid-binding protein DegV [Spiroplasma helicoides]